MTEIETEPAKELIAFNLEFRDKEHFNSIIKYMNANVGSGKESWTIEGRVLKFLKRNKTVTRRVVIYKGDFDDSIALYLTLI